MPIAKVQLALLVAIGTIKNGSEEATINGRLIHEDRVLLIVARVARDGDCRVDACSRVRESDGERRTRRDTPLTHVKSECAPEGSSRKCRYDMDLVIPSGFCG